jgi:MFS family permease
LAVDAVTFLISATFLIQQPRAEAKPEGPAEAPAGFWKEAGEGLKFMIRSRPLVIAIASMSAAAFMIFIIDSLGVLALKALGVNEALFGLAVGAIGLGTTLGALAVGQWGKRFNPLGIMGSGQALSGAMVAVLGGAVLLNLRGTGFEWALIYMVTGLAAAAVFVPYAYVLQINTPQQMLGRVFATADALETVFQLVAPPVGAVLSQIWGVGWVFGVAGAALAVVGLLVFGIGPRLSGQPAGVPPPGALEGEAPS